MKVLITGSSGGIGRAAAEFFLKEGHEVCGLDIRESSLSHPAYTHYTADITDPDSYERKLPADYAPEILVNCAGVQQSGRDIDINLKALIGITERYAVANPEIKSVVNIGSASAHTGAEFPEYAASKGGVISYTRNVAQRIAPRAVCNSIDPGGVRTELNDCVMNDEKLWARIMELTPLKRWAEPEEIAEWIYFVAVRNRFMTGQNLLIDGGEAGRFDFVWPESE